VWLKQMIIVQLYVKDTILLIASLQCQSQCFILNVGYKVVTEKRKKCFKGFVRVMI
jgi:hypothetical protein